MLVRQRIVEIEPETPPITHSEEPLADPLPWRKERVDAWLPLYIGLLAGPKPDLLEEPTSDPRYARKILGKATLLVSPHQILVTNYDAIHFGVVMFSAQIWAMGLYPSP